MKGSAKSGGQDSSPKLVDEPGMAERFQRGLQRALNTPPQPRGKPPPKAKKRPSPRGRAGR